MKSKHIFIIIALAILAVALFSYNNNDEKTDTTTSAEVSDKELVYPITTLSTASLQTGGWNPTLEVEGMVRIEDSVPDLKVEGYPFDVIAEPINNDQAVIVKYLRPEYTTETCGEYGLTTHPFYGEYRCLTAPPELFNEFVVLSGDLEAGDYNVLHKFRLKEGYSFVAQVYSSEGPNLLINPIKKDGRTVVVVSIHKWNDFKTRSAEDNKIYYLDVLTGEIIQK